MNSNDMSIQENTSTPKRRRLGTCRILKPSLKLKDNSKKNTLFSHYSPIHRQITSTVVNSSDRCESPPLPSNQVLYLHDSKNSSSGDALGSPITLESSVTSNKSLNDVHWVSLSTSKFKDICEKEITTQEVMNELEDISDDMFHSKLEQESSQVLRSESIQVSNEIHKSSQNHDENYSSPLKQDSSFVSGQALLDLKLDQNIDDEILATGGEKRFRNEIEESFELVNQSICGIPEYKDTKSNHSALFETKDSFLLDIKESGVIAESKKLEGFVIPDTNYRNTYYGLPIITKSLFKTYRNIEKFYDWQEECLSLNAIKEHRNLIYALPTSGGKTLVAEVLMMREVINKKKNALFILPFVAIVHEKIGALSPFALKLDFLVEEYAAGKGELPPKKRRKKNSIYIATIEKGLALVRSLIELGRLEEIGLIVVDELHLIGEPGRGGTLETLLITAMFANNGIQIVGMSATIGNLPQLAKFLQADVFERQFRPVELTEYVKIGDMLYKILNSPSGLEFVPDRKLAYDYSAAATTLDPDLLGGLVSEVVPQASCLVFCPTKRNCENVAALLCKLQRREMATHRTAERAVLYRALCSEGVTSELAQYARYGVAYHHAGLASDERVLLEQAFRSGVISVLCCTSTLAAGVNLPARRVIVRAPLVGRGFISLGAYRQMVGRAGRAGVCETGESIIMCGAREWEQLRGVLAGGLTAAVSQLRPAAPGLLLSAAALRLASDRRGLRGLLRRSLLHASSDVDIKEVCDESIRSLLESGALEVADGENVKKSAAGEKDFNCYVHDDSKLVVSALGNAAIKGGMDISTVKQLLEDLEVASRGLVLMGSLHLIYLVTPHDAAGHKPDYRHYYSLYEQLDEEGSRTAKMLGITQVNAIKMMTGKPITNVPERVLCRFYLAMMLHDLWKEVPFHVVAEKYSIPRGTVQAIMSSAASFANSAHRVCAALDVCWMTPLLGALAPRLQHCAAPALLRLMQLPALSKARAGQLMRAGYQSIEDVAKATVEELVSKVNHLSRTAATHLVSSARMMLVEKVENLRAEAEEVMEDLKM